MTNYYSLVCPECQRTVAGRFATEDHGPEFRQDKAPCGLCHDKHSAKNRVGELETILIEIIRMANRGLVSRKESC